MSFLFPSLLWIAGPLLAGVLLLHLLNLRRIERIEFAAIDFLLDSQQRSRTWVNLKQWLLLAARMLLVLLAVLMLARPRVVGGLADWLAADRLHQIVVLDDSFSMRERSGQRELWGEAIEATQRLVTAASERPDRAISIIRTSAPDEPMTAENAAELVSLGQRVASWSPTPRADQLAPALLTAAAVASNAAADRPVAACVIADFRTRNVEPAEPLATALAELGEHCRAVHLAPCRTDGAAMNLAVTELKILPSAQAAGVELTGEVTVANLGAAVAEEVTVTIRRDDDALPAASLERIAPGESARARFPVRFVSPGDHRFTAEIETDAIATDNLRRLAVRTPAVRKVLLVDGSPGNIESAAYAAALQPRAASAADIATGWQPVRKRPAELGGALDLSDFAAVLLLDVPEVDKRAAEALKQYVADGGGLLIGLGPSVDRRAYNGLLFGGEESSLVALQLDSPSQIEPKTPGSGADLEVTDHAIFRVFAGDRNSFLPLVNVNYYHRLEAVEPNDESQPAPSYRAIASVRGGDPLALETHVGAGRAIVLLTSVMRSQGELEGWSSLGTSPVFPILANELVAYLAAPGMAEKSLTVGDAWTLLPPVDASWPATSEAAAIHVAPISDTPIAVASIGEEKTIAAPGYYRVARGDGAARLFAVNVDPAEGALDAASVADLKSQFATANIEVSPVRQFLRSAGDETEEPIAKWIAWLALVLLAGEQLLAVMASFHQPAAKQPRREAA